MIPTVSGRATQMTGTPASESRPRASRRRRRGRGPQRCGSRLDPLRVGDQVHDLPVGVDVEGLHARLPPAGPRLLDAPKPMCGSDPWVPPFTTTTPA